MTDKLQAGSISLHSSMLGGMVDLKESIHAWRLWSLLGWLEIRQRYTRSKIGPLWLTISMGVMIGTMGVVYGSLFGQPLAEYLPVIAIGIVVWALFSSVVNEGCVAYINSSSYIRQVKAPRLIYILQVVWRNIVIFTHNFVIILVVLLIFGVKNWNALLLFIPGILLLLLNATWAAVILGTISSRFRDLPQIVGSVLQVGFYITPILFKGEMLGEKNKWLVQYNPLAYLIDVVRMPLLGDSPSSLTWYVTVGMAVLGWIVALTITGRYSKQISYWV